MEEKDKALVYLLGAIAIVVVSLTLQILPLLLF
jgi:hypothetical protein